MEIAALVTWLLTALGGFVLLYTWVARGGTRKATRFPPALIFGHFLLAGAGLVLWIIYVVAGGRTLAWIAFVLLLVVALLGFTMLARWIPTYRGSAESAPASEGSAGEAPAEKHFPVAIVAGHGLLAATTLVLVLLATLAAPAA